MTTNSKNEKSVLILGKGYVGSILNKILGYETFSSLDITYNRKEGSNLELFMSEAISKLDHSKEMWIINCTGYTGKPNVDMCEEDKSNCYFYNVKFLDELSKWCANFHVNLINITSGCIFDHKHSNDNAGQLGFLPNHQPNFGFFDNYSSFYSKTKDLGEMVSIKNFTNISDNISKLYHIRIRMPLCDNISNPKNILNKYCTYNTLIDGINSKTYIPNLAYGVETLINSEDIHTTINILHGVNPKPLATSKIVDILHSFNITDKNKKDWVTHEKLKQAGFIKANRSDCILSHHKEHYKQFYKCFEPEENVIHRVCDYNVRNE